MKFRCIKLPNGITALLISDPSAIENVETENASTNGNIIENEVDAEVTGTESDDSDGNSTDSDEEDDEKKKLAAFSLCVDVGSFSDPPEIQGLAHFLEHMIFMGSTKYPEENAFDQYIKKHGGSDNAATYCEETVFYFEITEEWLDGAVDIFSNLFKSPLLAKEAMTREREAVESEFSTRIQNDDIRKEQLLGSLGQPNHPCSIFTWGNLKTLKENIDDEELYRKVHEFRKRHYSAHRMYLSVQARMSLDMLQVCFYRIYIFSRILNILNIIGHGG